MGNCQIKSRLVHLNLLFLKVNQLTYCWLAQESDLISLDCNSLRMMRLIQAANDSSPSCNWAISISARNSGSSLNWKGGLPLRLFLCVDTSMTPAVMYLCVITHYLYRHEKTTPQSAGTHLRRLTNNR